MRILFLIGLLWMQQAMATPRIGPDHQHLRDLADSIDQSKHSGAVILNKTMRSEVDSQGFETYVMYVAIKILDEEGERDYTKLSSGYNAHYTKRSLDFAQVILPDGKVKPISEDALQVSNVGANGSSFDDVQTMRFALPSVKAGSIIELQHRSEQIRPMVDDHWFSQFTFHYIHSVEDRNWARIDPLLEVELQVSVANDLNIHWRAQSVEQKPKVTEQGTNTLYRWTMKNVPSIPVEANMGNFRAQMKAVYFTSLKTWSEIDTWAWAFLSEKINSDTTLQALAQEIVKDASTEREKLTAVFYYVQQHIRYIGAHVGRGGYVPHKATDVLAQAYGDCKDQTVLIIALLRAVGIDAFPALISPGPDVPVVESLPMLSFSHMITYVPMVDGQSYWLDTSGDTGKFPGIFGNLESQTAFVVNGKQGQLLTIEPSKPSDNRVEMELAYLLDGQELKMQATLSLFGHMDTSIRNMFIAAPVRMDFLRRLMSTFSGEQQLSSFTTSNIEDWTVPFRITMVYDKGMVLPEDLGKFNYSDTLLSLVNSFTDFSYLPAPKDKFNGFSLAYPFQLVLKRAYPNVVKEGDLVGTQLATEFEGKYISVAHQIDMNDQRIETSTTMEVKFTMLSHEQYEGFFNEFAQLKSDSENHFVYAKNFSVDPLVADQGQDVEAIIEHTRKLLNLGEFSKALEQTQRLIELAPKNGEAFYLHGLSLGFNNQTEKSEAAFDQADTLGYVEDGI